jgi:hypothetical protein
LLYVLLRHFRLGALPSFAVVVAFIIFPGSDSVRLWPSGVGAQFILAIFIIGILLSVFAFSKPRRYAIPLHLLSLICFGALLLTYEVVVPLICCSAILYLLCGIPKRLVFIKGSLDVALVVAFFIYRFVLASIPTTSFVVSRSLGGMINRFLDLLTQAWTTWKLMFVPLNLGRALPLAILLLIIYGLTQRDVRSAYRKWIYLAIGGIVISAVSLSAYITTSDWYMPNASGLVNRVNLVASIGYAALAVGILGCLWEVLKMRANYILATLFVGVTTLGVVYHQVKWERETQKTYAQSWREQGRIISNFKGLSNKIPANASIYSFGHPMHVGKWIPVFGSSWDLRGAIKSTTHLKPPFASPFEGGMTCTPEGISANGNLQASFKAPSSIYFFNHRQSAIHHVVDQQTCQQLVNTWEHPVMLVNEIPL